MRVLLCFEVMFKKRAAVFYWSIKTRGVGECFYSDKTRAASFLNGFKNIPQKRVSWDSKQRFELWGENISIQEKQAMPYQYSLYKEY